MCVCVCVWGGVFGGLIRGVTQVLRKSGLILSYRRRNTISKVGASYGLSHILVCILLTAMPQLFCSYLELS